MERKIGETFYYNGDKYVVTPASKGCDGCAFNSSMYDCFLGAGDCTEHQREDNNDVIFIKTENMEERTIKLSLEKAKEFYKKGGEFKDLALSAFSEKELKEALPKTWEKFCSTHEIKIGEYYINVNSEIMPINHIASRHKESDRNIFCNRQAAVAHLALMQLHQLRDCYRQGWAPKHDTANIYNVQRYLDGYYIISKDYCSHFLSFQNEEIANEFLSNFKDLIDIAGDLIG